MTMHAKGSFETKTWDEQPFSDVDGAPKLTHASMTATYHGDIEGEGASEYLIAYHEGGTATFVGMDRISGRIGDRSGGLLLQNKGADDGKALTATYVVVPGSGTGDLKGIKGEGTYGAEHGQPSALTLDYDFE